MRNYLHDYTGNQVTEMPILEDSWAESFSHIRLIDSEVLFKLLTIQKTVL